MTVESKTVLHFQGAFLVSVLVADVLGKFLSSDPIYYEFCLASNLAGHKMKMVVSGQIVLSDQKSSSSPGDGGQEEKERAEVEVAALEEQDWLVFITSRVLCALPYIPSHSKPMRQAYS